MAFAVQLTFCKKNLALYSQSVLEAISHDYPDVEIELKDCADVCGTCTDIPFALRNGALIGGRDPRDLYKKLERGMRFLSEDKLPGTAGYVEVK
ncbi:DUF1450 domain-containing protein [Ferroacidibacillus organovorans]|uniref:DUF1450 domain-containing protein n=1 Tax=Ferroacidibacillus organovorans TaxID=1765683 RepID=A0A853KCC9_9BACL|nr:DUF1450 domain-containing protein [Ferroacidibacillus organovorans]KYP80464.1 hypothetical protein AYJ22_02115 [Ferroacidibacillus organovorans]OAG94692.1 hypothetical protein AYW79_03880 [Ferroacidibacillus organovorans]